MAQSAVKPRRDATTDAFARRGWGHPALFVIYFILAAILLGALAFYVRATPVDPLDLTITRAVQAFNPPWFNTLMFAVGEPGYPPQVYAWVILAFIVLYAVGLKWEAIAHAFATVGIGVVGLLVKYPVDRLRPSPNLVHVANPALDGGKFSFPAGHVESYVAILGFFIFLLIVLGKPSWLRILEIVFFGLMIALIGLSRVYVGEHWPSDALGGYLLGSDWLIVTIYFYNWGKTRFFMQERARVKG